MRGASAPFYVLYWRFHMGIGLLRRHYERLHDANAEMGVAEGNFVHPNEDPEAVAAKLAAEAEEKEAEAAEE